MGCLRPSGHPPFPETLMNRTPIESLTPEMRDARERTYEVVAEAVSTALVRVAKQRKTYPGPKLLGELMGRTMNRMYYALQSGAYDTSISTLSDLAQATGHRLVITMEPLD